MKKLINLLLNKQMSITTDLSTVNGSKSTKPLDLIIKALSKPENEWDWGLKLILTIKDTSKSWFISYKPSYVLRKNGKKIKKKNLFSESWYSTRYSSNNEIKLDYKIVCTIGGLNRLYNEYKKNNTLTLGFNLKLFGLFPINIAKFSVNNIIEKNKELFTGKTTRSMIERINYLINYNSKLSPTQKKKWFDTNIERLNNIGFLDDDDKKSNK